MVLVKQLGSLWLSALLLAGCGGSDSEDNNSSTTSTGTTYRYQQPVTIDDGWMTNSFEAKGIDVEPYETLINNIVDDKFNYRFIDSVTVVKNNELLLDHRIRIKIDFADDWANNKNVDLHILNSVTKSVTSALIGIAIDQGYIASVDVKVMDYFAHKLPVANWDERKDDMTLKNWLTMRHGLSWNEWDVSYLEAANLNAQMVASSDPIQFLLNRPMATDPGQTFAYSTGVSFGLGRILTHATGMSVIDFMRQNLFEPLGIKQYDFWSMDGQLHTGSALYLTSRDMAKFGQLFLDNGRWQGQQVISADWVEESTQTIIDNGHWGYGYQWWTRSYTVNGTELNAFYGDGFGGQYIFVFPEIDAVVVLTGSAYLEGQSRQRDLTMIMEQHILPGLMD